MCTFKNKMMTSANYIIIFKLFFYHMYSEYSAQIFSSGPMPPEYQLLTAHGCVQLGTVFVTGNCLSQGYTYFGQRVACIWSQWVQRPPVCLNIGWLWRTIPSPRAPSRISLGLWYNHIVDQFLCPTLSSLQVGVDPQGTLQWASYMQISASKPVSREPNLKQRRQMTKTLMLFWSWVTGELAGNSKPSFVRGGAQIVPDRLCWFQVLSSGCRLWCKQSCHSGHTIHQILWHRRCQQWKKIQCGA